MQTSTRPALVVVDVQQAFDDPSWGPTINQPGCEQNVERLLEAWTRQGLPVVVVRHDSVHSDSPLHPTHPGNALHPAVAAVTPDLFVVKSVNSSFLGTPDLAAWLHASGLTTLVVCGIQTNMCVETTARMGGNLGFEVIVPLDATRTFDLTGPDGRVVDAATLMQVTATNLHGDGFARIATTDQVLAEIGASVDSAR